jgi:hypothetical protein
MVVAQRITGRDRAASERNQRRRNARVLPSRCAALSTVIIALALCLR